MKKLKNEAELVRKAIHEGCKYGEERGAVEFEPTDSAAEKIEYIYRLLVHVDHSADAGTAGVAKVDATQIVYLGI